MKFLFIQAHARIFHITTMCRVLEVSKAGYYAWRARPLCERVQANGQLLARIRVIHAQVKGRYGSPRVHQELRALGLEAKSTPRYRITTQANPAHPTARNVLAQQFAVTHAAAPDRIWAADLTSIPTAEGWLYLAVILDLATRRVVGWALAVEA